MCIRDRCSIHYYMSIHYMLYTHIPPQSQYTSQSYIHHKFSKFKILYFIWSVYTATIYSNEEDLPSIDGEYFKKESEDMETDVFLIFWPLQWLFEMLCGLVPDDPVCGYDVFRGNRNFKNQCQIRTVNWFTGRSKL